MTPEDIAFVHLCQELRALGATSVESGTRRATFTGMAPRPTVDRPKPPVDELDRFPKRPR